MDKIVGGNQIEKGSVILSNTQFNKVKKDASLTRNKNSIKTKNSVELKDTSFIFWF